MSFHVPLLHTVYVEHHDVHLVSSITTTYGTNFILTPLVTRGGDELIRSEIL